MELKNLQKHVQTLATLSETESPVISCYLRLDEGRIADRNFLDGTFGSLRQGLTGDARRSFDEAVARIESYLARELMVEAEGIALFSRAGSDPFFLPLQFRVPLPNWVASDTTPNIYHLVELKDNYHRYVVMIAAHDSVRILEVNLGEVTEGLWQQRPELRRRVGREWSKAHYQDHRREREQRFIKEQIRVLDHLMSAGGYTHLVLAGHSTVTAPVRELLPKHLASKLVDVVPASSRMPVADVVRATIAAFVEAEERESRSVAERLDRQLRTGGLAVSGTGPTLDALRSERADTLVLASDYSPGRGWACTECGRMAEGAVPTACPDCAATAIQEIDIREAVVRLAEQQGRPVEVVNESAALQRRGGVGCLLRYRSAEDYA